jgi:phosphoadenosine phosphosulfate reductase
MEHNQINQLNLTFKNAPANDIISYAIKTFSDTLTFSTSLSFEDQSVTHMLCQHSQKVDIFTLDTGRLFQETYDTIVATEKHYNIKIHVMFPNTQKVEEMVNIHGVNLFYNSLELRKYCCHIRKTEPLQKYLQGKKAWITGLRREQSVTRFAMQPFEWDNTNNILKINPLVNWTEQQTIDFVKSNQIPYNSIQDKGYRSIGCLPCTRPISIEEDVRAGRWWWEDKEQKECGLHK